VVTYSAGVCVSLKPEKCPLFLPSFMHAYPHHDPWKHRRMVKYCKGEMRVLDTIIGTNQLREITPIENPRSFKVAEVEHRASNLIL